MARSLAFQSGNLFFPERVRRFLESFLVGSYRDPFYISYWSLLHLVSGFLTAFFLEGSFPPGDAYWIGLALHTLWEGWQILIGMSYPFLLVGHNSLVDIVLDTLLFMIGMWVYFFVNR